MCFSCLLECDPKFIDFKIEDIQGLSIYEYNEKLKELIYKFKGCYDIELKDVFLYPYENELSLIYKGYIIIPIPSYFEDDEVRGFNHVELIFSNLKLEMVKALEKVEKVKQSEKNQKQRQQIKKYLKVKNIDKIKNKKILLVDDICTTGSTLKAAIDLLKEAAPKDIKILVLCKREMD